MGFFAHTASFVAGFAYVLYFLPPMGDGSLLPSDRPYVNPCAYNIHAGEYATEQIPECLRLFSEVYEYPVEMVRKIVAGVFATTLAFTAFHTMFLQRRVSPDEAALLSGCEVSAILCSHQGASAARSSFAHMEGEGIVIWIEVMRLLKLQVPEDGGRIELFIEACCRPSMQSPAVASQRTRMLEGSGSMDFHESLFLPTKFLKRSSIQLVVWEKVGNSDVAIADCSMTMAQALRCNASGISEVRPKLRAFSSATGEGSRLNAGRSHLELHFKSLQPENLDNFKVQVKRRLEEDRLQIQVLEQQPSLHDE